MRWPWGQGLGPALPCRSQRADYDPTAPGIRRMSVKCVLKPSDIGRQHAFCTDVGRDPMASQVRDAVQSHPSRGELPGSTVRTTAVDGACDDCRATTAFQAWHSVDLPPSFNVSVSFADWKIVPRGKRAVIE